MCVFKRRIGHERIWAAQCCCFFPFRCWAHYVLKKGTLGVHEEILILGHSPFWLNMEKKKYYKIKLII